MSKRKGFTLIEMLVVVLIIGILAAIAFPQYEKAVARSRLSGMITLASSIAQAEQRYMMAKGEYTLDITKLDVSLPSDFTLVTETDHYYRYSNGKIMVRLIERTAQSRPSVAVEQEGVPAFILWGFKPTDYRYCGVVSDSKDLELGKAICSTYGTEVKVAQGSPLYWRLY